MPDLHEKGRLDSLRNNIDALDDRLAAILKQRNELGKQIGKAKHASDQAQIFRPEREAAITARLARETDLPASDIEHIWTEIFCMSRTLQDDRPIAVAGTPGGILHLAARLALGRGVSCLCCGSVDRAVDLLEAGTCSLGVFSNDTPLPPTLHVLTTMDVCGAYTSDSASQTSPGPNLSVCIAGRSAPESG